MVKKSSNKKVIGLRRPNRGFLFIKLPLKQRLLFQKIKEKLGFLRLN